MSKTMRNFHVPLPHDLYGKLRKQSELLKEPATEIARKAIEVWLKEKELENVKKEIMEYALNCAGSSDDLDKNLEEASIEFLSSEEQK